MRESGIDLSFDEMDQNGSQQQPLPVFGAVRTSGTSRWVCSYVRTDPGQRESGECQYLCIH
jgi:hypothetical protein